MTSKTLLTILAPVLLAACGTAGSAGSSGGYGAATAAASSTANPAPAVAQTPTSVPAPIVAPTAVTPATPPSVIVAASARLGAILVNPRGRTLYYFVPERGGRIVCTGQCTNFWPPAFTVVIPATPGAGVTGRLGVIARAGGAQVTYNSWPLYTFSSDTSAGQTNGQGVFGFGGQWFVATPGLQP